MNKIPGTKNHIISIGLPVRNGEKFLKTALDCILNQTFSKFELIISDNDSTDSTFEICNQYAKKDSRIRLFKQSKDMGMAWNFNFVLKQAKCDYFFWIAADDKRSPNFIEKIFKIFSSNDSLVCCACEITPYSISSQDQVNPIDKFFYNFSRKIINSIRPFSVYSLNGSYENKVRQLFKKSAYEAIYGIFKTEPLKKSIVDELFVGHDVVILLNILRYGDIIVLDEVLMEKFDQGYSTKGNFRLGKQFNKFFLGWIFPHYPLTFWCAKNLGSKIFLNNIDHFIKLNLGSGFFVVTDILNLFLRRFFRN